MQLLLPVLLTATAVSAANNLLRYDDSGDATALHVQNEETRQFLGDVVRELAGEHLPLLLTGQPLHVMQGNDSSGELPYFFLHQVSYGDSKCSPAEALVEFVNVFDASCITSAEQGGGSNGTTSARLTCATESGKNGTVTLTIDIWDNSGVCGGEPALSNTTLLGSSGCAGEAPAGVSLAMMGDSMVAVQDMSTDDKQHHRRLQIASSTFGCVTGEWPGKLLPISTGCHFNWYTTNFDIPIGTPPVSAADRCDKGSVPDVFVEISKKGLTELGLPKASFDCNRASNQKCKANRDLNLTAIAVEGDLSESPIKGGGGGGNVSTDALDAWEEDDVDDIDVSAFSRWSGVSLMQRVGRAVAHFLEGGI